MDIRTATRNELEGRRNQIQQEKTEIETAIQKHRATEQKAVEAGDGRAALASRKAIATQQEHLERLAIDENAITKRLQEYAKNKPDAEKLKVEIEELHNQTASKHVNRIIRAQNEIVKNVKEVEAINSSIEDLASQYLVLCGEALYAPTITVPWIFREFTRVTTLLGPESNQSKQLLQAVEPFAFGKGGR